MRPENSLLLCPEDSETQVSWSLEVCNQGNKGDSTCLPLTSACLQELFFLTLVNSNIMALRRLDSLGLHRDASPNSNWHRGFPAWGASPIIGTIPL